MALTSTIYRARQTRHPKTTKIRNGRVAAINHAVRLIHAICGLAGSRTLIDEIRAELRADKVRAAIRSRDTGPVFDWLIVGSELPRHLGPSRLRLHGEAWPGDMAADQAGP